MKNFYHFEETNEHIAVAIPTMEKYFKCLEVVKSGHHLLLAVDDLYLATILARFVSHNKHRNEAATGTMTVITQSKLITAHDCPPELREAFKEHKLFIVSNTEDLDCIWTKREFDVVIIDESSPPQLERHLNATGCRVNLSSPTVASDEIQMNPPRESPDLTSVLTR